MEVGQIIFKQLGGVRFKMMTGVKDISVSPNSIQMKLPRNSSKANYFKVILDSNDTYTMLFQKYTKDFEFLEIKKYEGVYGDMLQELFTEVTGLYTSL